MYCVVVHTAACLQLGEFSLGGQEGCACCGGVPTVEGRHSFQHLEAYKPVTVQIREKIRGITEK